MDPLVWPISVLRPRDAAFDIAPRTLRGASSVSGTTQVVSSAAGVWTVRFESVLVNTRDRVNLWRAIAANLEGQLNPVIVPHCAGYQPRVFVNGVALNYDEVPHSDETFFSDDQGYVGRRNSVVASASAAIGATVLVVRKIYGGDIEAGQSFSINYRMYRIKTVADVDGVNLSLAISPPLREAITNGDDLEFDRPALRCRLASDNEMDLMLVGRRRSEASISFIEDV